MNRDGKRSGAGRKPIEGKEMKIKVPEEMIEQLSFNFVGKSTQDQIRECLEYGISKKNDEKNEFLINQNERLNVLDLFSGAGGLSRGFLDAGFNVVLGIDNDDIALKTFKENHRGSEVLKIDLSNHNNLQTLFKHIKENTINVDVLVGGPPCQGYSLAGPRKENDERNKLYESMVEVAKFIKPKVIVLENVPGLVKLFDGKAAQRILNDFNNLGYHTKMKILYAPDYGVPQIRKRVFFVGFLDKENFEFPKPMLEKENYITCEEAIDDLPSLENSIGEEITEYNNSPRTTYEKVMRGNSNKLYNHVGTKHEQKTIDLISLVPEGKNYRSLPDPYNTMFKYNEALTRYHSKKPSLTINTGHRSHFHYKWNRIPTVRESARLQSFTDDFIFFGNKSQQYRQVGNAVPPLLGKALAISIKNYLLN